MPNVTGAAEHQRLEDGPVFLNSEDGRGHELRCGHVVSRLAIEDLVEDADEIALRDDANWAVAITDYDAGIRMRVHQRHELPGGRLRRCTKHLHRHERPNALSWHFAPSALQGRMALRIFGARQKLNSLEFP
jgi:hypothetical protein